MADDVNSLVFDPAALSAGAPQGLTPPGSTPPLPQAAPGGNPNPMMERADDLLRKGIISPDQYNRIKAAVAGGKPEAGVKQPDIAGAGNVAGNLGAVAGDIVGRAGKGIAKAAGQLMQPQPVQGQDQIMSDGTNLGPAPAPPQGGWVGLSKPITGPSPAWEN